MIIRRKMFRSLLFLEPARVSSCEGDEGGEAEKRRRRRRWKGQQQQPADNEKASSLDGGDDDDDDEEEEDEERVPRSASSAEEGSQFSRGGRGERSSTSPLRRVRFEDGGGGGNLVRVAAEPPDPPMTDAERRDCYYTQDDFARIRRENDFVVMFHAMRKRCGMPWNEDGGGCGGDKQQHSIRGLEGDAVTDDEGNTYSSKSLERRGHVRHVLQEQQRLVGGGGRTRVGAGIRRSRAAARAERIATALSHASFFSSHESQLRARERGEADAAEAAAYCRSPLPAVPCGGGNDDGDDDLLNRVIVVTSSSTDDVDDDDSLL